MSEYINLLTSPEFYAVMVALLALLKGLAEILEAIGALRSGRHWEDNVSGKLLGLMETAGKVVNTFAPGSKGHKSMTSIKNFIEGFKKK